MLKVLQLSVQSTVTITASTAYSQCSLSAFIIALLFTAHCHVPLNPLPMSHTPAYPPGPSLLCLLLVHLAPISLYFPIQSLNHLFSLFSLLAISTLPDYYCHSILFHISTLSTASTSQACNKFQFMHFFFPSINLPQCLSSVFSPGNYLPFTWPL